ncbi:hypothetical protein SRABI128_05229 [Microbacterium sp. Bi128]|nr:hypothetical protein SRABI128_05229 [Microbacterium sp. Bi128]
MQSPFVEHVVDGGPLGLGLVGDEVLGAGADALALDAVHVRGRQFTGEERVLGQALEVPARQR